MSSQVTITQLPTALALTGAESVPIVQNGVTVQTTTGAIAGAGALNYPFLTVGETSGLTEARYLSTGPGLSLTDNGAGGSLQIVLTGAAQSIDTSDPGIQVKINSNTVVPRQIAVGTGLSVANADGVAGNPTVSLGALLQQFVSLTGTGVLALQSGSPAKIELVGVTNQISISNGNGAANPTFSIATNAVFPGVAGVTVPNGTTAQRAGGTGAVRYNTNLQQFEGYTSTGWNQFSLSGAVTSFSAGTTGFTPNTDTTGAVTLGGILLPASGGTGASTLTGYVKGNGIATMTASATVPTTDLSGTVSNAQLTNSAITINGSPVSLGGSITVTATASNALTIGTGLTGTSYNGSAPVTITIDSTVATLTGSQTLTNKVMSGTNNLFSDIGNTSLTNSAITIGSTAVSLGGTITTLTGTSISGSTNTLTSIGNSSLTNSSLTLGTTTVALGATSLTLGGLTSVAVTQDPTAALQLATKQYVDTVAVTSVHYHSPVYVESPDTAGNLNATYNQPGGAGDGVGATLTNAGTQVALTIDGVLMTTGKRVLIYNQTSAFQNGIYTVTTVGDGSTNWVLTRATDADTYSPISQTGLGGGDAFFVQAGATGAGETYVCSNQGVIVFGTTGITFVQISSAPVYSAGSGLTLTGTTFSITAPVTVPLGGTGVTTLTGLAYGNGTSAFSAATAAQVVAVIGTTAVTNATNAANATNTAVTADSTNATNYLTFVSATTGNLPQLVNSSITCNPSTGKLTGGIAGGAF